MKSIYNFVGNINEGWWDDFKKNASKANPWSMLGSLFNDIVPQKEEKETEDQRRMRELRDAKKNSLEKELAHRQEMRQKQLEIAHQKQLAAIQAKDAKEEARRAREKAELDAEIARIKAQSKALSNMYKKGAVTEDDITFFLEQSKIAADNLTPDDQEIFAHAQEVLSCCCYDDDGNFIDDPEKRVERGKKMFGDSVFEDLKKSNPDFAKSIDNGGMTAEDMVSVVNNVEPKDVVQSTLNDCEETIKGHDEKQSEVDKLNNSLKDIEGLQSKNDKIDSDISDCDEALDKLKKYDNDKDGLRQNIASNIKGFDSCRKMGQENGTEFFDKEESARLIKEEISKMTPQEKAEKFPGMSDKQIEGLATSYCNNANSLSDADLDNATDQAQKGLDNSKQKLEDKKADLQQQKKDNEQSIKDKLQESGVDIEEGQTTKDAVYKLEDKTKEAQKDLKSYDRETHYEEKKGKQAEYQEKLNNYNNGNYEVNAKNIAKNSQKVVDRHNQARGMKEGVYVDDQGHEHLVKDILADTHIQMQDKKDEKGEYVCVIKKDEDTGQTTMQKMYRSETTPEEYAEARKMNMAFSPAPEKPSKPEPKPTIGEDGKISYSAEDVETLKEWQRYRETKKLREEAVKKAEGELGVSGCFTDKGFDEEKYINDKVKQEIDKENVQSNPEDSEEEKQRKEKERNDIRKHIENDTKTFDAVDDEEYSDDTTDAERTDNDDDLEDEADDEDSKKKQNPAKIWKQRSYKRGDKTFKTTSYYNKKGDSISKKEFLKRKENYQKSLKENLSLKPLRMYILEHLS